MSGQLGSTQRPLRVAIIGAGPSGFYAAQVFFDSTFTVTVDLFDRLPAPFGLVRYGVAPDHPKIKNVTKVFEKTADHPNFAFFGNVGIGKDISVEELKRFYDATLFTCGAQTDKRLEIPGEDLKGSHTATEFVAWYNGHPDYKNRVFDLKQEVAVIIGQGNVAMDVSRILCKTPDELKATDIAAYALDALAGSKIKDVHLIGRRGPMQAAFTPPEIKEFGELADCDVVLDPATLELNEVSLQELNNPQLVPKRKNYEVLKHYAERPQAGKRRKFYIHFLKSPLTLSGNGKVESLQLGINVLTGEAGKQNAKLTEAREQLACGLVFRSVGYRGVPIPGIPFDEKKGTFANLEGRLTENGKVIPGLYAAGWIKRGPTGVIGTNKPDSEETVKHILSDLLNLKPAPEPARAALESFLKQRKIPYVTFPDWKKIDAAEISRGQPHAKPREKFTDVREMLKVIGK